jgi:aminoglycoside 6'-N-acetyltransferase I
LAHGPFSEHWAHFFLHTRVSGITRSVYEDNALDIRNNKLNIRKFTLEDRDRCVELFQKVFTAYPWYDEWVSFDQAGNYLDELIQNPVFEGFVAFEGSDIVAVCFGHRRSWWMGKEFFVDEFYVENERQGNGIGTKILDFVTNTLGEDGYTRLTLLTNKDIPAEEFYLKPGFYNNLERTVMVKKLY